MRTRLGLALAVLFGIALIWATLVGFSKGGQDFRVFHYAANLVLEGRWENLYQEGPDRYLYAPGFAFLLAPLGALPFPVAHAIWMALILAVFLWSVRMLVVRYGLVPSLLAVLFLFRTVAIDLRYGQVNLLILGAAVWALTSWFEQDRERTKRKLVLSWFVFSIAAFAKIYPLALFIFPLVGLFSREERLKKSAGFVFFGAVIAATLFLAPPLALSGVYSSWFDALSRKGLPTDTHNQSFLAFLTRMFSGEPFFPLGMGGESLRLPGQILSPNAIRQIGVLFALVILELTVRSAWRWGPRKDLLAGWIGLALCFLPAHLIWKSYFALGIPLVAAVFSEAAKDAKFREKILIPLALIAGFLNFSSGDFVGAKRAGWIEAGSPFLWVGLFFIFLGYSRLSARRPLASPP